MIVLVRILLYIAAGWLSNSGYINEEIKSLITNDPEVAFALQVVVSGMIAGATAAWWRLAKRWGWQT